MNNVQAVLEELTCGDEVRAENSVPVLIDLGMEAIPALLELTTSLIPDSRWWALRTLAQSPLAPTEWLIPFLKDPSPDVRQCVVLGLGDRMDESAISPLVGALSDENALVCNLAVNSLVKIGKDAVPSLIETVKGAPQSARIHALRALAEIRDHRAIPVMMHVMEEESALLQHWAKAGLERLGLDMVYMKPV